MKSISKLKDDARKHELREEWDKAVQVYLQVLAIGEHGEAEIELPLYNRVGDLYVRLGRPQDAVRYYEQAADRYAEAGLYNNAIALCNKAMRYQPQQLGLLRKLGMFSALQGFYPDARRYFVEYADKQIAQGKVDDALNALNDFARIADDAESRELLGRRLHERGRTAEAVVELRVAHGLRLRSGQTEQAEALRREIRSIDPTARFEQDPPSSSFDHELPGMSSYGASARGAAELERSSPAKSQLEEEAGDFGMVEIAGFDDFDDPGGSPDTAARFDSPGSADNDFFQAADDTDASVQDPFDLPLLADTDAEATQTRGFGVQMPGAEASSALDPELDVPAEELAEYDDFAAADFDLPLIDESPTLAPPPGGPQRKDVGFPDANSRAAAQRESTPLHDESAAFDDYGGADSTESTSLHGFEGWPEDPEGDVRTAAERLPPRPPGPPLEEPRLDMNLDDFAGWNDVSEVEEMALEAAAASERALREAAEAERLEEEARETAAREAAAREAAAREAAAREAAAREAEAREAELRGAAAREAEARDTEIREAAAREKAAREAETRAAEERDAQARLAATREAARHDPWARPTQSTDRPRTTPAQPPAVPRSDERYVDLGSLLEEDEMEPESTRFRINEVPTGDEDEDFAELLSRFKEKVAEHLPPEDAAAHYDLGLAFKEMGLIDEAIAEFQVALRTGHMRLKVYEELGYCFLHKRQYKIAEKVLRQALQLEHGHELELLGIYYQLGRAYEAMGHLEQARDAYERVLGMDLHFQDTSERLARL